MGSVELPLAVVGGGGGGRRRWRPFTLADLLVVLSAVGLVLALLVPWYLKSRATTQAEICQRNLRRIEDAKALLAFETKRDPQAKLNAEDLQSYLRWIPACPSGGQYDLGRLNRPATCSYAEFDPRHVVPPP